ncbi:MAG TPA: aspartate-semialdehyde dehydrogenase, partial [Candidatus Cloacimonadota bacterium]|nr:aspartate-semialdehyde dehydrogenase [Candidatus Cloacimonadota bacterium]
MKIGIVGATGEVGMMMIKNLDEFEIPVKELRLFASSRSAGKKIKFRNDHIIVEELTEESMKESFDYLLYSAGSKVSKKFAPIAAEAGNTVIDNSSAFRRDEKIPLIVP